MPLDSETRKGNGHKHKESFGGRCNKSESNKEENKETKLSNLNPTIVFVSKGYAEPVLADAVQMSPADDTGNEIQIRKQPCVRLSQDSSFKRGR